MKLSLRLCIGISAIKTGLNNRKLKRKRRFKKKRIVRKQDKIRGKKENKSFRRGKEKYRNQRT